MNTASHQILFDKLIDWHQHKHPEYAKANTPNPESEACLHELVSEILEPLQKALGEVSITYGFNSAELNRYVQRINAKDTGPKEDQHASKELNLKGKRICTRDGASCDLYVEGYENQMHKVALYITQNLPFDRLYFYGKDRPLHVSFGPDHSRYIQYRRTKENGDRVLAKVVKIDKAHEYFADF
ncbi:hypothetical protein [Vibrio ishigakensis]|nr:hypothetical protein [Vibrio ishigakensis]